MLDKILSKINTNSASLFIAFVMSISGIYMCFQKLSHDGYIDIKSAVVSGRLETGSVGLLVIFISSIIVISVLRKGVKQTTG